MSGYQPYLPPAGSIGTAQIADGAVTTPKLADGAVTGAKIVQTGTLDIGATSPTTTGTYTGRQFLASNAGTAAAPNFIVEPSGNSGAYWDATKGVVIAVDGVDRVQCRVNGTTEITSGVGGGTAVLRLTTVAGDIQVFAFNATPEGSITASPGDECFDYTNGRLYLKRTGTGNTGWVQIDRCESGTYTPTATAVTNLDSVTAQPCHFIRVGNEVTVDGLCAFDPTASGSCTLRITLPVPSNLAASTDLRGPATSSNGFVGFVRGDTTNDAAEIVFPNNTGTSGDNAHFAFTYTVL